MSLDASTFESIEHKLFRALRDSSQFKACKHVFTEATGHKLNLSPLKEKINPSVGINRFSGKENKFDRKLGVIVSLKTRAICVLKTDGCDSNTKFMLGIMALQLSKHASNISCKNNNKKDAEKN